MIGEIIKHIGDGRYEIKCGDGIKRIGLARGTMRRRACLKLGDTVEIELRDFEPFKSLLRCKL